MSSVDAHQHFWRPSRGDHPWMPADDPVLTVACTPAPRPDMDHVLTAFGPERPMWGANWPVASLRCEYWVWHALARDLTDGLGSEAQAQSFGGTARTLHRISS